MTFQEQAKAIGVKVELGLILMQDLPSTWTGPEQWDITHHQGAEGLSAKCLSDAIGVVYESH